MIRTSLPLRESTVNKKPHISTGVTLKAREHVLALSLCCWAISKDLVYLFCLLFWCYAKTSCNSSYTASPMAQFWEPQYFNFSAGWTSWTTLKPQRNSLGLQVQFQGSQPITPQKTYGTESDCSNGISWTLRITLHQQNKIKEHENNSIHPDIWKSKMQLILTFHSWDWTVCFSFIPENISSKTIPRLQRSTAEVHSISLWSPAWARQFCNSASGARYPSVWMYFTS